MAAKLCLVDKLATNFRAHTSWKRAVNIDLRRLLFAIVAFVTSEHLVHHLRRNLLINLNVQALVASDTNRAAVANQTLVRVRNSRTPLLRP